MGTFLKYLIYIALVIIAVLILRNLWDTGLTNPETVAETVITVSPEANNPQTSSPQDK